MRRGLREGKAEQARTGTRHLRNERRQHKEFNRTAILADEVCTALGCTKEVLCAGKILGRFPHDGKRGRFHAWLPAMVEAAMTKVAGWQCEDATRINPGCLCGRPQGPRMDGQPDQGEAAKSRHGRCNQQINLAALTFTCGKIPRLFGNIIILLTDNDPGAPMTRKS
jgi:hypothetical protein